MDTIFCSKNNNNHRYKATSTQKYKDPFFTLNKMDKPHIALYVLYVITVCCLISMIIIVLYVYFRDIEVYYLPTNLSKQKHYLLPEENISQKDINDIVSYVSTSVESPSIPQINTSISYRAKWYGPPDVQSGTALCFSGGGVMAMTHCCGFLRGFHASGYLPKVSLVSAASGSCWAVVPSFLMSDMYTENNISLDTLYGSYIPPEEETVKDFETPFPEDNLAFISTNPGNLSRFMHTSTNNLKNTSIPTNMVLPDSFAQLVLSHLKMYCHTSLVQPTKEKLHQVMDDNPELTETLDNTFILRDDVPPFTVSMTGYFGNTCGLPSLSDYTIFPLEYTAEKAGFLCSHVHLKNNNEQLMLGNQISNYAWNSNTQKNRRDVTTCSQDILYNIGGIHQMVSLTSFIFESSLIQNCDEAKLAPSQKCTTNMGDNQEIWTGDGGEWDNSALTAALVRKMPNAVVFLLDNELNIEDDIYPLSLAQIFGRKINGKIDPDRSPLLPPDLFDSTAQSIISSQHNKYSMDDNDQWNPAIYTQTYICLDVEVAGIESYEVKITWVLPRRTYQYQDKLKPEVYKIVENMPNYPAFTTSTNLTALYNLTPQQARAVISLDSWMAKEILTPLLVKL